MFDRYQQINSTPTPLLSAFRPNIFNILLTDAPAAVVSCVALESPLPHPVDGGADNSAAVVSCVDLQSPAAVHVGVIGLESAQIDDLLLEDSEGRFLLEEMLDRGAAVVSCVHLSSPAPVPVDGGADSAVAVVSAISFSAPVIISFSAGSEQNAATVSTISVTSP